MLLWHVHLFCYIFHYFSLAFWCSCAISHTSRTCSAAIFEIGNSICCTNQTTRWHNYSTSKFQFSMKTEQKSLMRYMLLGCLIEFWWSKTLPWSLIRKELNAFTFNQYQMFQTHIKFVFLTYECQEIILEKVCFGARTWLLSS